LKKYWREILMALVTLTLVVASELMIPRQIQRVIDQGIGNDDTQVIITSMVIMIGLALTAMALLIANIVFSVRTSEGFAADLRGMAFHRSQELSFSNLDELQTGEMLVRLTSDINITKSALMMTLRMVFRAPLMIVGSLAMLVATSPKLALLLVVILPATVAVIIWFSRRSEPMFKALQARLDIVNTVLQENIAGVRVVKSFVRANHEIQRFGSASRSYMQKGIEVNQLVALLLPTMLLLINLSLAGIVWFGGLLSISGQLTTGEIVAFSNYMLTTMFPVMMLGMILPRLYAAEASVERILQIVDAEPSVRDRPGALVLDPDQVEGRVCFENVSLHYSSDDGTHVPVLRGISLTAEPGETVAILGATGSGKSSLVNLVPRFYDVTEGRVTIDGVDVRDITQHSLRRIVGIAPQESVLFDTTVRDNIRFGRPDASDEEVVAAAKAAQAHDFIMRKPLGYDEPAGRRGANFSGGQRQRIAIARAIAVRPKILVLDDATSAVDAETEAKIHEALHEVIESCTSFIVAQRVSTVLTADKIVVLDDGRVSAIGTHRELMATSRIYREIYDSQLGGGPLAAAGIDRGDGGPPGGAVPEADGSESGSAASGPVDEEDGDA
jgi:ATP-binding cassette subfamily B protein